VHVTVSQEHTPRGPKLEFVSIERAEVGPTGTPEAPKERIIQFVGEKLFEWCKIMDYSRRKTVYEEYSCGKSFIPIFEWHRGVS